MISDLKDILLEMCPVGFMAVDGVGAIEMMSKSAEEILGRTPEVIPKEDLEAITSAPFGSIITLKRNDGSDVKLQVKSTPGRDKDAGYKMIFLEDRSEHDRMLKLMIQREKLSSLGTMVAGIAHEINNPLASISGQTQILISDTKDPLILEQIRTIDQHVQRASTIVRNLMQFAKQQEMDKVPCDLNQVVENSLKILYYRLRVNDIKIESDLAPNLPRVLADASQIQQVIVNIVNNAEQAILSVRSFGTIKITTGHDGRTVYLTIGDDGSGIKSEDISKIFDPFYTTNQTGKGAGIGLSVSYGIIKDHGGEITVDSFMGAGSTFKITLPITEVSLDQIAEDIDESAADVDLRDKEILVIDDEKPLIDLIKKVLEREGCKVTGITSAIQGIQLLTDHKFDGIISDIKMPGLDGKALFDILKTHFLDYVNKIAFVSGDTISLDTSEFLKISGRPYLIKPFQLPDLIALTKRIIKESSE